jgi:hypothetical protein
MAFPASTNVDGSNPGPNSAVLPDTVQMPTGNIWKIGVFSITLTPAALGATTNGEQTFAATGIGLLTSDLVVVQKPSTNAGILIGGSRVSAADTLAINFANISGGTLTPTAAEVYKVGVFRIQPNWIAPATGNQLDW